MKYTNKHNDNSQNQKKTLNKIPHLNNTKKKPYQKKDMDSLSRPAPDDYYERLYEVYNGLKNENENLKEENEQLKNELKNKETNNEDEEEIKKLKENY